MKGTFAMDVTLNPLTRQISALYTARFAEPEEKKSEVVVPSSSDQVTISQEGIKLHPAKLKRPHKASFCFRSSLCNAG